MEATLQRCGSIDRVFAYPDPERSSDPRDLEKAIISAGCQLKRIVCSRLVGELSDSEYDVQKSQLLERYGVLTRALGGAGYSWQASAEEADTVEIEE